MEIQFIDHFDEESRHLPRYYQFWNDEQAEKKKKMWVDDENYEEQCTRIIEMQKQKGLYRDTEEVVHYIPTGGVGISLAAGSCWDAAVVVKKARPKKMYFLDFSEHRIFKNAPIMLKNYLHLDEICDITLIHGDYYNTKLDGGVLDFASMSMALMMAEYPERLLAEVRRLLKPKGIAIIMGEPRFSSEIVIKSVIKMHLIMLQEKLKGGEQSEKVTNYKKRHALNTDSGGANAYAMGTYKKMFRKSGFRILEIKKGNPQFWGFVLQAI